MFPKSCIRYATYIIYCNRNGLAMSQKPTYSDTSPQTPRCRYSQSGTIKKFPLDPPAGVLVPSDDRTEISQNQFSMSKA